MKSKSISISEIKKDKNLSLSAKDYLKKPEINFESTGLVYGKFWGGGEGSYPARKLKASTRKELIEKAKEGLNGSLDAGMGFESLIGAVLNITKTTFIIVKGRLFNNTEYQTIFIGKLTRKQKNHLLEHLYL